MLDIACGNGNFSQRMAKQGAQVVALYCSPQMIKLAIKHRNDVLNKVSFHVCDATNYNVKKEGRNLAKDVMKI